MHCEGIESDGGSTVLDRLIWKCLFKKMILQKVTELKEDMAMQMLAGRKCRRDNSQ